MDARKTVTARANGWCEACGFAMSGGELHHRKLRSQGGQDEPANLILVHSECHRRIHAHPRTSYERGLLVYSWQRPAAEAVWITTKWHKEKPC